MRRGPNAGKTRVSLGQLDRLDWRVICRKAAYSQAPDVEADAAGINEIDAPSRLPRRASTGPATITARTADEAMMTASGERRYCGRCASLQ